MDTMGQTLLAGAGFTLQQDIIIAAGDPRSLMLQSQELAGFADHAVQAVTGAVACSVGDRSFQIFDRHRHDQRAFDLTAHFDRHDRCDIFISTVLRDPGDLTAVRRYALQSFFNGDMFIIQENVFQLLLAVQTLLRIIIAVFQLLILTDPVHGYRQLVHHQLINAPVFQHGKMLFDRIFHRQKQRQQQVIRQIVLIQREEGNNIADLAVDRDWGAAGIAGMAVFDPHFRAEHQKGHIMLTCDTDAGSTHILFQHAHTLDILDHSLEKGQGIIFDHITVFVDQQHAQVMDIEMLFALFIQTVDVFYDKLMGPLVFNDLFPAQFIQLGHRFMGQLHRPAALPGFGHPGMDVWIDDAVFHKLTIIGSQFFLVAFFTDHYKTPPQFHQISSGTY